VSAQDVEIPDRLFGETVVCDQDCPLLTCAQTGNCDGWDLAHAKPFCRFKPAMPCKDCPRFVDEDWVGPDLSDAFHQSGDLAFRVPAGIAGK